MNTKKTKPVVRFDLLGLWPGADVEITKELMNIVFDIVEELFGKKLRSPVLITNYPDAKNPLACYDMKDGCYQVHLCVKSGLSWCQIVYQLAHELCHLHSNYADSKGHKHKWFEESLCEMCSIVVLIELSEQWKKTSMHRYNYAASIKEYAESLNSMTGYVPKSQDAFISWLAINIEELERNSENRVLNGVVARYLFNNRFSTQSTGWACVGMLNQWNCHENLSFTEYKDSWRRCCADSAEVNEIVNLL
ncbi:hypothetical protein [Pseudomonas sp. FP198]|uniref:hypothetical protein n=1 Tax=Pseudomonas sp. FP198 TaxID=2954084 RepID=UPI002736143F|nr:hypothetical protein [Pseudomonas sp. FP198]WLG94098.1 hypothetical protein PSH78_17045 [Pseudomonas sp. FP198]